MTIDAREEPHMRTGPSPLSTEQIDQLRAELADGRRPMVWFTPAAVGVDAGRSAKLLAMGEPPDGDFIQVRPTGSQDELSFSPNELTMEKPARRKKSAEPVAAVHAAPAPVSELLVVREKPARRPPAAKPAAPPVEAAAVPEPVRRGRGKQPAPVTVTLSSTPEGEWTVEVLTGSRRSVRAQPIGAGAVASAAKALGGDIEAAIEGALRAAREQQSAKVARLEAELATARQALDELS